MLYDEGHSDNKCHLSDYSESDNKHNALNRSSLESLPSIVTSKHCESFEQSSVDNDLMLLDLSNDNQKLLLLTDNLFNIVLSDKFKEIHLDITQFNLF